MKRRAFGALTALTVGLCGGGLLGGCGSQTKTVSATNPPAVAQTNVTTSTAQPAPTTKTATTPTASTPTQTTTSGGNAAPTTTRTAPEPAFAQQEGHTEAEGVSAAAALVRARGYTPNDTSEYHADQALRVLVGTRTGSGEGYGQQAFFFVNGHYIGTDAKEPSATVKVLAQSDTEVTLAYSLYRKGDPLSSPSGGQATVHFQLDNGKLTPMGTIPPASSTSGLARN